MFYDSHAVQQQLIECKAMLEDIFKSQLISIYLYGSYVVGGLQRYSDLDVLVLLNHPASKTQKTKLIARLLQISGKYMKDVKPPLEVTVVVQNEIKPWHYPACVDFQYGEWLREKFESGLDKPYQKIDMPDLAIIITQILLASQTLYGPDAEKTLEKIPYNDFITAITHSIKDLINDLFTDTRNVLLTLARIWYTLETDLITSKPVAAKWASSKLPATLGPVIDRASAICQGVKSENWEDIQSLIQPCAIYILHCINDRISHISIANVTDRVIKLTS